MASERSLSVREMLLSETEIRINYLHNATDDYLQMLGVERTLLPTREEMRAHYQEDYKRPIRDRLTFLLAWELDSEIVGFSSVDRIEFGNEAFMHLHILDPNQRKIGLGTAFVKKSAEFYFRHFELKCLYSEPNAFNVASNRTLQKAGFRYLFTHVIAAGPINLPRPMTRWILEDI